MNLSIGDSLSETYVVTSADLISEIDDSLPNVLGTYNIVKWSEITSGGIPLCHLLYLHIRNRS